MAAGENGRKSWWVAVIGFGLMFLTSVVVLPVAVVHPGRVPVVDAAGSSVFWFWMTRGALRRTNSRESSTAAPARHGGLSRRRAVAYLGAAIICGLACIVAFFWQRVLISRQ